ncbi:ADP-ribosylglycohydrolase family protein [Nonomuraea polychroma]|uniref:ADP-ribosylglycohydrolase family protein n=1 Tax=Nonomuraea polychroma TaxID=46176 RepID=UPI003D89B294
MLEIDLRDPVYSDKVHGCWLGKNAGGTLGAPVEQLYGESEPLDVRWYTDLREGGIPNDDLELQLIWLLALEEVGPGLTAKDLARYWLDHVGYNFDEYGMAKANLRLGLEPPLSGHHNNWFADCMGCPIRSEIWACVAPGAPRIAAQYAYQDAILDHAGGESVYGELFNAALESAAFVVGDRRTLVDIGLSYVPEDSRTAAAVRAAVTGHAAGLDWRETRRRVLAAAPHHVAQYSPVNLGFQVIGLLYGADFGDALRTTVNCGWDTDSSGAAIGSYLGILAGRSGLSEDWTAPLGESIATNESWGGVRNLAGLVPATLAELTDRIRAVGLRRHGGDGVLRTREEDLYADASIAELWAASPTVVGYPGPDLQVSVDYGKGPAVVAGRAKEISTTVRNRRRVPLTVHCALAVPEGWKAPQAQDAELPPGGSTTLTWQVEVPDRAGLEPANRLLLQVSPADRPEPPAVPVVLLGAAAYRISGPYRAADEAMERTREGDWREVFAPGHAVPLDGEFDGPGVLYVQTFAHAPRPLEAWLAVEATCPVAFWANGEPVAATAATEAGLATGAGSRGIRPCHRGSPGSSGPVALREGWNEVLIKLVRGEGAPPVECHVLFATNDRFRAALTELGRTRFPWDLTRR